MTSLQANQSSSENLATDGTSPSWKIKLLYDGECPLCLREVNFLQRKDAGRNLVAFVDIAAPDYDAANHGDVSFEAAMGRIHAVLPDNTVIRNVAVFRQVYAVLGIGWLYAPTRWPVIGWLVDRVYDFWADRRLRWTGRPPLETIVAQRQALRQCDSKHECRLADSSGSSRCQVD